MAPSKPSNLGPGYYTTEVTTVTTRKIKYRPWLFRFSKEKRRTFLDEAIQSKLKLFRDESYENREEFPNPPKYMNVHKKLAINDGAIKKYWHQTNQLWYHPFVRLIINISPSSNGNILRHLNIITITLFNALFKVDSLDITWSCHPLSYRMTPGICQYHPLEPWPVLPCCFPSPSIV